MKKLFAMLLALAMVFSLVACSKDDGKKNNDSDNQNNGGSQGGSSVETKVVHKLLVFQNNLDGLTAKEVPWASGKDAKYNGYNLYEFVSKNGLTAPSADTACWFVAGTDKYAGNLNYGDIAELYIAIDDTVGKGRTPISCGESNNTANMPFNMELIVLGENAIFMLDCPGSNVGKISEWLSYMKDAEVEFDVADNYTFTLTDGTTKTVAKADIDTVDLKTVKYMVAG